MPRYTIPMAKNIAARCLRNIVDPVPTNKERAVVWEYFGNCCAYCGIEMNPADRVGQLDHVIPVSEGGSNHLTNFVLSCPQCNGGDKRDMDWVEFIDTKTDGGVAARKQRIEEWISQGSPAERRLTHEQLIALDQAIEDVKAAITTAAESLRDIRSK